MRAGPSPAGGTADQMIVVLRSLARTVGGVLPAAATDSAVHLQDSDLGVASEPDGTAPTGHRRLLGIEGNLDGTSDPDVIRHASPLRSARRPLLQRLRPLQPSV